MGTEGDVRLPDTASRLLSSPLTQDGRSCTPTAATVAATSACPANAAAAATAAAATAVAAAWHRPTGGQAGAGWAHQRRRSRPPPLPPAAPPSEWGGTARGRGVAMITVARAPHPPRCPPPLSRRRITLPTRTRRTAVRCEGMDRGSGGDETAAGWRGGREMAGEDDREWEEISRVENTPPPHPPHPSPPPNPLPTSPHPTQGDSPRARRRTANKGRTRGRGQAGVT